MIMQQPKRLLKQFSEYYHWHWVLGGCILLTYLVGLFFLPLGRFLGFFCLFLCFLFVCLFFSNTLVQEKTLLFSWTLVQSFKYNTCIRMETCQKYSINYTLTWGNCFLKILVLEEGERRQKATGDVWAQVKLWGGPDTCTAAFPQTTEEVTGHSAAPRPCDNATNRHQPTPKTQKVTTTAKFIC